MKYLLSLGFLGSALANVLDSTGEHSTFQNGNKLSTNIGNSTIVTHTLTGLFDVTSTISAGEYYDAIGNQQPKLGLDIGNDIGDISAGVDLQWSSKTCTNSQDNDFTDISTDVACTVNGATRQLKLCDIGYTGGGTGVWVATGCIRMDRDTKYYGFSQRSIQFYDTYLSHLDALNPYAGAAGAVSIKEKWQFNLANMAYTDRSSVGVAKSKDIDASGKATVPVSVSIRVGTDDDVFGDCSTDTVIGQAKTLGITHPGAMIGAFSQFHSDWKNGENLTLTSLVQSQVSAGALNGTDDANKCKITYSGNVERQFPINDMHAAYYDVVDCAGAECERKFEFNYDGTTWDAAAIDYLSEPTSISKESVPDAVTDAQAEVTGVGWLHKIPLVKSGVYGLFTNVADKTDGTPAIDLLQTISFTTVTGTTDCDTGASELYKLTQQQIDDFHSSRERQCKVAYPDPYTKYDVPSKFTFHGVQSADYEPNILNGSAVDPGWDYGSFAVTDSTSNKIRITYTPSNITTAYLVQSCSTSNVSVVGTGAPLLPIVPATSPTCTFNGDSLTSLDLSNPALFISYTVIAADQSTSSGDTSKDYNALRCKDVTLSATTNFTTEEKSDFLPTKTAQASASVTIAADNLPLAATYDLTSNSTTLLHSGTAPDKHDVDVIYDGQTKSQELSRQGNGALVYNCGGTTKQQVIYSKTLQLPCGTQQLTHTRSSKVQFTVTQATLTGYADTSITVQETAHNTAILTGGSTVPKFYVTSDAIQHLGAGGPNVTCADSTYWTCTVGAFEQDNGFPIDVAYYGAHDNIASGGGPITFSKNLELTYDYNEQCSSGTETETFKVDVTIKPDPNKFRGKITVQDLSNDPNGNGITTSIETLETKHIGDLTIQTRLPLNNKNIDASPTYKIEFFADSDTDQEPHVYTILWNDAVVQETSGISGATGKQVTLSKEGNGHVQLTLNPGADKTVALLEEAASFKLDIKDAEDNIRSVFVSIINLEPEAKLMLTDCTGNSQQEMDNGQSTSVCSDKCCYSNSYNGFKSISFDLITIPKATGTGNVADLDVEILDPDNKGHIVVPTSLIEIKADKSNANQSTPFTLATTANCKGTGQFTIKLHNRVGSNTEHIVKFPCRRHANQTNIVKTVILDYGLVYSADPAKLTFDTDPIGSSSIIYAGAALTCANGAKGGTAQCDSVAGTISKGSDNARDIRELAQKFQSCGSWDSAAHNGSMDIVRQYTVGSINYCQENVLTISVLNTGRASATVTTESFGTARVAYSVSKLEYSSDDCPTDEFKYLYELTGTITSSDDDHTISMTQSTISHADISLASGYSVKKVKAESACRAVCTDTSLLISGPVTHTFTVVVDVHGEQIHTDVQAVLTLGGSPCGETTSDELIDNVSIEFKIQDGDVCNRDASYSNTTETVNLDQYICATISGKSDYDLLLTAFEFSGSAGKGKTGNDLADFYYGGFGTLVADETIAVTADWEYNVTTGGRRMLRTSYTLGSNHGESHASLRVLPAGVQIQEQIEAGVEAAPAHDVIYNKTFTAEDVADHQHTNANWGLGLGIGGSVVGVGFIAVWIYTGWKRTQNGGTFLGGGSGYQKVGRFETNMAF